MKIKTNRLDFSVVLLLRFNIQSRILQSSSNHQQSIYGILFISLRLLEKTQKKTTGMKNFKRLEVLTLMEEYQTHMK
jgi:hypothetical protein